MCRGERAEAIIVVSSRLMTFNQQRILEFAARQRLPVVAGWGPWVEVRGSAELWT